MGSGDEPIVAEPTGGWSTDEARRPKPGLLIAAAVFAAVVVVGATVWLLRPSGPPDAPVGETEPATVEELVAAVADATEPLAEVEACSG